MSKQGRNWGGAREGAGRKPEREKAYRRVSVVLSEDTLKRLDKLVYSGSGSRSRSKTIEQAVIEYLKGRAT